MTKGHLYLMLGILAGVLVYENFVIGKVPAIAIPLIGSSEKLVMAATIALAVVLAHKVAPVTA